MEWYYSHDGSQHGPVSQAELQGLVAAGNVLKTDLAWHEGMVDWIPVSQVEELNPKAQVATQSNLQSITPPAQPYQPPAVQQPQAQAMVSSQRGTNIPNYLWQSIVVTLFCCLPGGIVAIVYASKVDGLKQSGDFTQAVAASKSAQTWCWISFGVGLVGSLLYFLLVVVGTVAEGQ